MAKTLKDGRKPKRIFYGDAIKSIWDWFVVPFMERVNLRDNESRLNEGLHLFFNTDTRSIYLSKCLVPFEIPQSVPIWRDGQPHSFIKGVGPRTVRVDDPMVVRLDSTLPNKIELEFKDHVFVLTGVQWGVIKEKVELVC